jgi:phosphopentomutase
MLFVSIVLDGVGIGAQLDSGEYGDAGAATLQHVIAEKKPRLPNLERLGLGNIAELDGLPPSSDPLAAFGRMREVSAGKDSTTGHWELAGLVLDRAFPTYPDGFPSDVLDAFIATTGVEGVLGNRPASGTAIIDELGEEHQRTGRPIVYTSADSVFQIAAHVETIPLEELYRQCRIAREEICTGDHAVGRVIARPFEGAPGAYRRISHARKDFSIAPHRPVLQQVLQQAGVRTISIGKISDLFAGVGFDEAFKTKANDEGISETLRTMRENTARPTFVWVNLVDFDQEYGHRNDPEGFAAALEEFDQALPELMKLVPSDGRLLITADHGTDPTYPGTDHTREYVPVLLYGGGATGDVGIRRSFADHAATVSHFFGVAFDAPGESFLIS